MMFLFSFIKIQRLEAHANNLNSQLCQANKQNEMLSHKVDALHDQQKKLEQKLDMLSRELNQKNCELDALQDALRTIKEANCDLEHAIRDKDALIEEQMAEREHLKNELNDARYQLQHCL